MHESQPHRVELCTAGGATLRSFSFEECDGGPHATRGMRRSTLLRALAEAMPADGIRFGAVVADVAERPDGGCFACFDPQPANRKSSTYPSNNDTIRLSGLFWVRGQVLCAM